ncbi:MAG: hypothetical protein KatS3mg110_0964 [Pirellulaceae bacterium]|nr:MAG: hypothetical protein KatS3mg110_0964 [Pirellulaceae bacterium]
MTVQALGTRLVRGKLLAILILFLATAFALFTLVWAQSGTRQRVTTVQEGSRTRTEEAASFEERFWNYLQSVRYQNWASLPGASSDSFPGHSPHGAFVKLFANRTATSGTGQFPPGSIIIKENYGPDRKALMAITVMYRSAGFDPENSDWYWVKYEPDGRVSQMAGKPISGRVAMCIECHKGAGGNDFVFAND